MPNRNVKAIFFLLLCLCVAILALTSGRGAALLDPDVLSRLARFGSDSPVLFFLLITAGLPAALLLLFLPEVPAVTVMVSALGFWPGFLLSVAALLAAAGSVCALTRALASDAARQALAARIPVFRTVARDGALPIEYCLFGAILLLLAGLPAVLAGLLAGLAGMRAKAFCLASLPVLFARTAVAGLATVSASGLTLVMLCLLGTLVACASLCWLFLLSRRRQAEDREEAKQTPEERRRARLGIEPIRIEELPPSEGGAEEAPLSLAHVLVVCVTEKGEEDTAALIMAEAASVGARTVRCALVPATVDAADRGIAGGFAGRDTVCDLDELFVRGFQEGVDTVVAVHAVSPLVRRGLISLVCEKVKDHVLVLGESGKGCCLAALRRPEGGRGYERGLLAGRGFGGDIAFCLAGLAPHPFLLQSLPLSADLRPMVSVLILAGSQSETLAATVRAALHAPWTECILAVTPDSREGVEEAVQAGADVSVCAGSVADRLTEAARSARAPFLLFIRDGVALPENFEEAVWQTMRQEKCSCGGFSLPLDVPSYRRTLRWIGTAIRPGTLSGPGLDQGLFLRREDLERFGGFLDSDRDPVAGLVARAGEAGRVILHNARVTLPGGIAEPSSGQTLPGLLRTGRERLAAVLTRTPPSEDSGPSLQTVAELTESCDHCGRCTHVSPMLHRHGLDLADLAQHPLLAWHCFLCGACTEACHKGIDGVALVRQLRAAHVRRHGNRMARPGHARTLLLARLPLYARRALPGKNLLLDTDFCCAWPRTAAELARRFRRAGLGVIVGDCGAALADLGMEAAWKKKLAALRVALAEKGVTSLYTVSPATQRFLVAMGLDAEPAYACLGDHCEPIDLAERRVLVPCADRARRVFQTALQPLLKGEAEEIDVPCCGAGGEAAVLEPAVAAELKKAIRKAAGGRRVLTTCTGCGLALTGAGIPVDHALSLLMGIQETAATGPVQIKALAQSLAGIAALGRAEEAAPEERETSAGQEESPAEGREEAAPGKRRFASVRKAGAVISGLGSALRSRIGGLLARGKGGQRASAVPLDMDISETGGSQEPAREEGAPDRLDMAEEQAPAAVPAADDGQPGMTVPLPDLPAENEAAEGTVPGAVPLTEDEYLDMGAPGPQDSRTDAEDAQTQPPAAGEASELQGAQQGASRPKAVSLEEFVNQ